MPTQPIHADHIQPTEAPWLLEFMRTTQVHASSVGAPVASTTLLKWVAPCDGMLENLRVSIETAGTAGTNSVDFQVAGSSILDATIDIAGSADNDGVDFWGAFTDDADAEITQSTAIYVVVTAIASAGSPVDLHVNFDFVALGRTA